jgi:beta-mannosidase
VELTDWTIEPGPPGDDADDHEFVFTTRFSAESGPATLCFDGIATIAQVELNGERILESDSMWQLHTVEVGGLLRGDNELVIRCLPLTPLLAEKRKPRARWRTRIVDEGNLRWIRTTLLGRMPGIAPGPPVVGPWRPVRLEREAAAPEVVAEETTVADPAPWFPHTHGSPVPGGSRTVEFGPDGLRVNGVPVFVRGAVWTPVPREELRSTLEAVRDAGMNMLRIPGIGCYETDEFFDLCDELGILVWQDFMFANMDYPFADEEFRARVEAEARAVLDRLAGHPSLAVLCGNSEVEQQAAMLGLDPELGRDPFYIETLPALAREAGVEVPYFASAPTGGALPFRFDTGVAHYFGVGGYRRPLADARLAGVRFASECLAFANVPDGEAPDWAPRDSGSDWDFADVREHYRALLHGDHRSRELDRAVTGEVMAEVFGEWRRDASPCGGGLVLWLRDTRPGEGWGVLAHDGRPKAAYHHLRRALAPVAVWTTDEGLAGVAVHVANDRPEPLSATLRVALYRDSEVRVEEVRQAVELPPHGSLTRDLEEMLGHFADASYAYRFGPPQHDTIVVSLEDDGELISQAFRFPAGRPAGELDAGGLGLEASLGADSVTVRTRKLAYGVRIEVPGFAPGDDAFCIEPGGERTVALRAVAPDARAGGGSVRAINLRGTLAL